MIRRGVRRRLLAYSLWVLVAPTAVACYAFVGARVDWAASAEAPPATAHPWALSLTGATPRGASSAVALVSYAVGHDHARTAAQVIRHGNRLIAHKPTGYRLAHRLGPHLIAVRARRGRFIVCQRTGVFGGVVDQTRSVVECAITPLPLRFRGVVWTSGATVADAASDRRYREARALEAVPAAPSTRTIAALGIDWIGNLGHGPAGAGFALVLVLMLLGATVSCLHLTPRPPVARHALRGAVPAVLLVAADAGARIGFRQGGGSIGIHAGMVDAAVGRASLHRGVAVWGNEGPLVAALLGLAVGCAAVIAVRSANRALMFAAAVTLLGTLTNWAEVAVRGYDTDYLWLGSALRTTPFNLGDLYEFAGGIAIACLSLRIIAASAQGSRPRVLAARAPSPPPRRA
jgi:hypothetical protein